MEKQRPPPGDVQKKTSEKKLEIGEETVFQNKLSLHIETDNICQKNVIKNESIYDFLQQQQGKTKHLSM